MQEPIDPTLSVGDSKYADLAKTTHANSETFCAKWNAGMEDFMNGLAVRRGYIDEMEKLIGVRDLGKHPDGIRGGVSALLGLTSKLEVKSSAGWKGFIINELLSYFELIGEDKILKQVDNSLRVLSMPLGFAQKVVENPGQSISEFIDALRKTSEESVKDVDLSNIDKINEYVGGVIKTKWAGLSDDTRLAAADLESKMATETAQIFTWCLEPKGIMVTVYAHLEQHLDKPEMKVSTMTRYKGVTYAKEYTLKFL